MKVGNLSKMFKGWVIGNFEPSIFKTDDVEVAVKKYSKGEYEPKHFHKIATEITIICDGRVKMNGVDYYGGDIIKIEPGEITDFTVIEDTITTVIKLPCVKNDKYLY